MARFKYRLKQVFDLRERKMKEHEQRVIQARERVKEIEQKIDDLKREIISVRQHMLQAHHTMMAVHDQYIYSLNVDLDLLNVDLDIAKQQLKHEEQLLQKAMADLKALEKHREKMYQEWLELEKQKEMKLLDEVAGQRYFRNQQAELEEQQYDAEQALWNNDDAEDGEDSDLFEQGA